jgi:catechol 2,3-dioxygenase-like lactoylglutathione lyase family enzyme
MKIEFIASFSVITADPKTSRRLYIDALGLPLKQLDGDYYASEEVGGCKHFGIWPLTQAAEACFGTASWPDDVPIPQVSLEFELADAAAVARGADELRSQGYQLLHDAKQEPWGQTVARLLCPEDAVVGLSYAPWLHEEARDD